MKHAKRLSLGFLAAAIAFLIWLRWFSVQMWSDTHLVTIDELSVMSSPANEEFDKQTALRRFDVAFAQDPVCSGLSLLHWPSHDGISNTAKETDLISRSAWTAYFDIRQNGEIRWTIYRKSVQLYSHGSSIEGDGATIQEIVSSICTIAHQRGGSILN